MPAGLVSPRGEARIVANAAGPARGDLPGPANCHAAGRHHSQVPGRESPIPRKSIKTERFLRENRRKTSMQRRTALRKLAEGLALAVGHSPCRAAGAAPADQAP